MTKGLRLCTQVFVVGISTAVITACDEPGGRNFDEADRDAERRATARFQRTGDLIEIPIGDIVVVAPRALPDSDTYVAMSRAREPRLARISLHLFLPDFTDIPADLERRNRNYVDLVFSQVPRAAYPSSVEEEFAERTAGYTGPISFDEQISYFEHPANIQRYFVFADPDFRRPDGSKPWLFCQSPDLETFTTCDGRGGWISDSVRWSYGPLASTHISDWPRIDEQLAELVPTFIKQ